jgi:hypothetical protein
MRLHKYIDRVLKRERAGVKEGADDLRVAAQAVDGKADGLLQHSETSKTKGRGYSVKTMPTAPWAKTVGFLSLKEKV